MATANYSIERTIKNFSGGVTGNGGVGKQIAVIVGGTPQVGDKFNIKLGTENFGFVGKPSGRVTSLETLKDKVYAGAGSVLYYSGIGLPEGWDYLFDIGAGFNNMANSTSGQDNITGLAKYQGNLAVFSRWNTQIWFVDPEPSGNRQLQVLDNIGALSSRSIVAVGDIDVFFLSDTGIRSLRARDSSNAAFVSDIGTPIDPLIIETLRDMSDAEKSKACCVVEPEDGRYWLSIGPYIYVFTYFPGGKISAWGRYRPLSPVRWLTVRNGRVYARCEDGSLLLLGGANNAEYDGTEVLVVTPFMDARQPGTHKQIAGIDLGVQGEWVIDIALDPANPDQYERVAQIDRPTFSMEMIPVDGITSHFKLRARSVGDGYARLSNIAVHYDGVEAG
ncbi:MAG TPA: hypothetical protein VGE88_07010 [Lysobacter sp.]